MKPFKSTDEMKFLGVENDFEKSKVIVLPVPYWGTVSYMKGTENGPSAIIDASWQLEEYDVELGWEISSDVGVFTSEDIEIGDSPEKTVENVKKAVAEVLKAGRLPVVLGGEHSISSGAYAAVKEKHGEVDVLQIDAHSDLREEFEESKYSHACIMKRVRDAGANAVQVGIRSMSIEEKEYIEKNNLSGNIFGAEFDADEVVGKLGEKVYITIDLDGFDPSEVPAVGTPQPGGLKWKHVHELLRKVCEKKEVMGFDVVELCPIPGNVRSDFLAAKLTYKLMGYIFK